MKRAIAKLLIANRGEIARRIVRSAHDRGIATVAVFGTADRDALHVREADEAVFIGDESAGLPYLNVAAILQAAERAGADAIHPGYGFLAEQADFAEAVIAAGLLWVGPPPPAMRSMAEKDAAKERAQAAGVPVVPGFSAVSMADADIAARCQDLGFPVLIKAVAGGGGRGMRVVNSADELAQALSLARAEAIVAFGDDRLLVERCIARGRHVEVQIMADMHGNVVHLFERECSIQRRHQKLVEESPSPGLRPETRAEICAAAVTLAHAIGYVGAGTVEFLVDDDRGEFHFLEVNARIQVEHPVTELVTGVDLVAWQLHVAEGRVLPLRQEQLVHSGHAIEVRLCAEDARADHRPQAGEVLLWRGPSKHDGRGVRVDGALARRDRVSMHYDSMVAKIIVHAPTRTAAIARLRRALGETVLLGLPCNRPFLQAVLAHPAFERGRTNTRFIAEHRAALAEALALTALDRATVGDDTLIAAALFMSGEAQKQRFRNNAWRPDVTSLLIAGEPVHVALQHVHGDRFQAAVDRDPDPALMQPPVPDIDARLIELGPDHVIVEIQGHRGRFHAARDGDELWLQRHLGAAVQLQVGTLLPEPEATQDAAGAIASPTAAVVAEVHVSVGDVVSADDPLVTVEAMKMLTVLRAPTAGTVRAVLADKAASVAAGAILVELDEATDNSSGAG